MVPRGRARADVHQRRFEPHASSTAIHDLARAPVPRIRASLTRLQPALVRTRLRIEERLAGARATSARTKTDARTKDAAERFKQGLPKIHRAQCSVSIFAHAAGAGVKEAVAGTASSRPPPVSSPLRRRAARRDPTLVVDARGSRRDELAVRTQAFRAARIDQLEARIAELSLSTARRARAWNPAVSTRGAAPLGDRPEVEPARTAAIWGRVTR